MASLFKKAAKGELPGQRKSSGSRGRSESNSTSPTGENGADSPSRVIPPEPVQQAPEGDFSLNDSERPLQVHNLARASKLSKALEWDTKLARDAEAYAQILASTGTLERSGVTAQGENLYKSEGEAKLEDAVDAWLNQEKLYKQEAIEESGLQEWGYFTQCVWQNTLRVGMGKARAKNGNTFIVARYAPPGNVVGEMPYTG